MDEVREEDKEEDVCVSPEPKVFLLLTAMSNTRSLAVLSAPPRYQPQVRR